MKEYLALKHNENLKFEVQGMIEEVNLALEVNLMSAGLSKILRPLIHIGHEFLHAKLRGKGEGDEGEDSY